MNLYDINAQLAEIVDYIEMRDVQGAEVAAETYPEYAEYTTETLAEMLDVLGMMREEKLDNLVKYIKNLGAEAEALKAEKQRLAQRQQVTERKMERLKSYLMTAVDGRPYQCQSVPLKVTWRRSEAVEVPDIEQVPAEYRREKVEVSADKVAIKKAIKAGAEVPGAQLVENFSCQIK